MLNRLVVLSAVVLGESLACAGGEGVAEEAAPSAEEIVSQSEPPELQIIPLDEVKASQSGFVAQTVATTQIEITYDRPVARGRELFGGIVAYGEIWNPGANDATKISLTQSVTVNGMDLPADVYHTPYPGEEHDALRLQVTPERGTHMETLAFYFPAVEKKDAELRLHWGETIVPFEISVP